MGTGLVETDGTGLAETDGDGPSGNRKSVPCSLIAKLTRVVLVLISGA